MAYQETQANQESYTSEKGDSEASPLKTVIDWAYRMQDENLFSLHDAVNTLYLEGETTDKDILIGEERGLKKKGIEHKLPPAE